MKSIIRQLLALWTIFLSITYPCYAFRSNAQQQQNGVQTRCSGRRCYTPSTVLTALLTPNKKIRGGDYPEKRKNLIERYTDLVDEQPLLTKAATAGIVAALSDLFAQVMLVAAHKHDFVSWHRTMAFLVVGTFFTGPYLHVWYGQLDKIARQRSHTTRTFCKMLVDQTVGVTIFFPLFFMAYELSESLVMGRVPMLALALDKCREGMFSIILMNWRVWPLAHLFNFGFVKPNLQILVNQVMAFFWSAYVSTQIK